MKDEQATDIEDVQKRLAECKRAPWTSWLFLLLLLSLGAVVYYMVDGMSSSRAVRSRYPSCRSWAQPS